MHRRGVKPYAMLKGFANTCDAFHQTATSYNGEARYLRTTKCPRYSSTKAFTGHTTSASGAIEAVICLLAIKHSFIPTSLGCTVPMDMLYKPVMETIKDIPLRNVLMNSFGFGGNDTSIVFTATAN